MHKTTAKILSQLRKDRNSTVTSVAKAAGVDAQVARRHLDALVAAGVAAQESVKTTGKRGRPAKLYRRAA
jgi:predicted ArsR family transcriptional regulator